MSDPAGPRAIGQTLTVSFLLFVLAAAAEEMLFRGYPLQTLTRANLAWLGVLLTSVPFAVAHLWNPNVVRGFTFESCPIARVGQRFVACDERRPELRCTCSET